MRLPVAAANYAYAGTSYANPHAPTTIGGATYSYDNNGNLTGNGTWTCQTARNFDP